MLDNNGDATEYEQCLTEDIIDFGHDKEKFLAVLKEIFRPGLSILAHGTNTETAPNIMTAGLESKDDDLDTTTIPIFDNSATLESQVNRIYDTIMNWPHRNLKAIFILGIPDAPENGPGGRTYFNSIFEPLETEDTGYNNRYVIPRQYIMGYFNAEDGTYHQNMSFAPAPITTRKTFPHRPSEPDIEDANQAQMPMPGESNPGEDISIW